MHPRRVELVLLLLSVTVLVLAAGLTTTSNTGRGRGSTSSTNNVTLIAAESVARVKRGYSTGHSTGVAYNRINDAGQVRLLGGGGRGHGGGGGDHGEGDEDGHREGGGKGGGGAVGEDGTHTTDFRSYGVGYEHRNAEHCEESKCGYNIRHCPHGCVFNSLLCGGGRSYDTCCC